MAGGERRTRPARPGARMMFNGSAGRRLVAEWRAVREPARRIRCAPATTALAAAILTILVAAPRFMELPSAHLHGTKTGGSFPPRRPVVPGGAYRPLRRKRHAS